MLISCQNCATSYEVDPSSLGATGRSVRCVHCQRVWFAANTMAFADIARAHRADLGLLPAPSAGTDSAEPQSEPGPPQVFVESPALAEPALDSAASWSAMPVSSGSETGSLAAGGSADEIVVPSQPPLAVVTAPPLVPVDQIEPATPSAALGAGEDIETVALRRANQKAARRLRWPLAPWPTAILVLIAINAALIVRRADVVRWAPQTASLYSAIGLPVNLRGLVFTDLTTKKEIEDGVQVLVVEGTIVSDTSRAAEVPRLRFGVRNEAGREIYSWTALPDRKVLPPGETMPFRSLLATPPREGRDVVVRFFNRRDLVADIQ
jgi:predicted Zn finger-like uncharacterized protein